MLLNIQIQRKMSQTKSEKPGMTGFRPFLIILVVLTISVVILKLLLSAIM
jgi:hypothetical protein